MIFSFTPRAGRILAFGGTLSGLVVPRIGDSARARPGRLLRRVRSAVGRRLPVQLQAIVEDWKRRLPSAGRLAPAQCSGRRATVVGFLTSPTGLGEGARLCASTLADLGFEVGMLDATPLHHVPGGVPLPQPRNGLTHGDVGGTLICHINPPDFQTTLSMMQLSGARRKLVAYWAWELPVVPRAWQDAFRLVHEAWVPSRFVADALRASGFRRKIRIVPHPLRETPTASTPEAANAGTLTVLTVFAYDSGFDRKNPLAAVDAFRLAFGDRSDVRLVIKVRGQSVSGEPERRLAHHVGAARNIEIASQVLTNHEMTGLLASADVFLSLHRAEGFGIPLAEAMLMGKPVVATHWSGNLEFMNESSACLVPATQVAASDECSAYAGLSATWAEPSLEVAAAWLRRLEDQSVRRVIGQAARAHALKRLGSAAFADTVLPAFNGAAVTTLMQPAGAAPRAA